MKANSTALKRVATLAISLAISAGLLYYVMRSLDWSTFRAHLRGVEPWYLLPLVLLLFLILLTRIFRWRELLPPEGRGSLRDLMDSTLLGFFASIVLPLRAGEVIRPLALARWRQVPLSTALATVVTERLWDALTLLALLSIALPQLKEAPEWVHLGTRLLAGLCAVLVLGMLLCYRWPDALPKWIGNLLRRWAPRRPGLALRAEDALTHFVRGLKILSGPLRIARVAAWSLVAWLLMAAWYQMALWAFGEHPSWLMGMVLNLMISMAVAAPSAPGFIGTFQMGCVVALTAMGPYSKEFAVAYSVVTHMLQVSVLLLAGFVVLHLRGLHVANLRASTRSGNEPA